RRASIAGICGARLDSAARGRKMAAQQGPEGTMDVIARLGMQVPVIQAPMAGVSTPALAAAVSNAGGLGSLGLAAMTPEQAAEAMAETRRLTARSYGVNLFCHQPLRRDPVAEARWLDRLAPHFARFGAAPPAALADAYPSTL